MRSGGESVTARLLAWELVRSGLDSPARELARRADELELEARDRGLVRRLVDTEARRRGTLRALVRRFASRKVTPDLAVHLHLGLIQLFFLDRIPDHAAVDQSVGAARATLGEGAARFTNAVLRESLRARREGSIGDLRKDLVLRPWHFDEPLFHDPIEHPLLWAEDALSMPAQIMKRWTHRFGGETARKLALQALSETELSVRNVRISRDELEAEFVRDGIHPRRGAHDRILLVPHDEAELALASAALREGRATVQGESALCAALAVEAREGERVLDLCAAPGGKTAVLAESGASVVACDVSEAKLALLRSTAERLKLVEHIEIVSTADLMDFAPASFDAVLVDAPCSNTGVLARRPQARWRFGPKAKEELVSIQRELFARAAPLVRPGGRLVWSTCSLESDENAHQVKWALAAFGNFELELEHESLPELELGLELGPDRGRGPVDGGYFARLVRPR